MGALAAGRGLVAPVNISLRKLSLLRVSDLLGVFVGTPYARGQSVATVEGAKVASTVEAVVTHADLRLVARTFPSRFGVERAFNAGEEDELAKKGPARLFFARGGRKSSTQKVSLNDSCNTRILAFVRRPITLPKFRSPTVASGIPRFG